MKKKRDHKIKCAIVCVALALTPAYVTGCSSIDLDFFGADEKISDTKEDETTESQTEAVSSEKQETTADVSSSETSAEASPASEEVSSETTETVIRQSSGGAGVATEEDTEGTMDVENGFVDEYILPYSNSEYLTHADLEKLNKRECMLARNEIYARRGRLFQDEEIQAYFDSCSWYHGTIAPEDFTDDMLNAYEQANKDLIVKYEQEMGYK